MVARRASEIAKNSTKDENLHVGLILGILGRQGSVRILNRMKKALEEKKIK